MFRCRLYHLLRCSNRDKDGGSGKSGKRYSLSVALEAGRQLVNRLFGGAQYKNAQVVYDKIPTVVFAHPEADTIGLAAPQAREKFGTENVKTYQSKVSTMCSVIFTIEKKAKHPAEFKIVCEGPDEKIVGIVNYEVISVILVRWFLRFLDLL